MKAGKTPLNGPGRVQKGKAGGLPAMPMNKRVLDTSGGECFPLEEPVHPVLRGHVSPMERIFRKFGKNPFHLLPGNFRQDNPAAFLSRFQPRGFSGHTVKNVPCPLLGIVNSDRRAVGGVRPGFDIPGLPGRADEHILDGHAFQDP